ncbi:hypothetical protein BAUCODRAFT_36770 [Baudoinia panamericana UAMH 10762]|uniref:Uncharacterized protein n=1 Tax=Baudoinia panamericana (strain UAMH 10762) TaxID=717646 RepID=M2MS19_BAUPA|nr:uncharacterized protein BAUCODRAFT_36770 [Baudoinia panamericana UAMH 10762]EMC94298.1 hypothetical protein BAUCODRAFT_36770 [Baudoinia panamericana UAMH 10762]
MCLCRTKYDVEAAILDDYSGVDYAVSLSKRADAWCRPDLETATPVYMGMTRQSSWPAATGTECRSKIGKGSERPAGRGVQTGSNARSQSYDFHLQPPIVLKRAHMCVSKCC